MKQQTGMQQTEWSQIARTAVQAAITKKTCTLKHIQSIGFTDLVK